MQSQDLAILRCCFYNNLDLQSTQNNYGVFTFYFGTWFWVLWRSRNGDLVSLRQLQRSVTASAHRCKPGCLSTQRLEGSSSVISLGILFYLYYEYNYKEPIKKRVFIRGLRRLQSCSLSRNQVLVGRQLH